MLAIAFPARFFPPCAAALLFALLISCAGRKPTPGHAASAKPKASPAPSAIPTPSPTPETRYVARVSIEGGETTEQELTRDGKPSPSPAPSTSPTPLPSPTPTPKPKSSNPLADAWQKIFPAKTKPTPTPTPAMVFRVSTADGGQAEIPIGPGSTVQPDATPGPTPIMLKTRPTENFVSRAWHRIFPKKAAPPTAETPRWIGVVKLVNERDGYALVDAQNYAALPPGETLNAVDEDRETGVLRVTADRQAPFFIADIVSGKPRAGDRVYSPKP